MFFKCLAIHHKTYLATESVSKTSGYFGGCRVERGGLSHIWVRKSYAYSSIKITGSNTCKLLSRPGSPSGSFCGSHRSAPSYSNGLTVEKRGGGAETTWLMGQWHAAAGGFMSQGESEYWERRHHVTLAILRIIWQCIMLEICHAKKMSAPSPVAEITTHGAVRNRPPPPFLNSLWTVLTWAPSAGAILTYSELATAKNPVIFISMLGLQCCCLVWYLTVQTWILLAI